MSDKIDVSIISTDRKGKTATKQIFLKYGLKEHLKFCERKLAEGEFKKIKMYSNDPDPAAIFPNGESDAEGLKEFWVWAEQSKFFLTEQERDGKKNSVKAGKIVNLLLGDLRVRSVFCELWEQMDQGTINDIRQDWQILLEKSL